MPMVTTDVTLEVALRGTYRPGLREKQRADGTWEPGEGSSIEDMRVLLVREGRTLDITALLPDDKLRELEEDGVELCALNGG